MLKSILAVLLLAVCSFAQSALVVPLSDSDATKAKKLHQAMLDAEKEWSDYQEVVRTKYLIVDKTNPAAGDERWYPTASSGVASWGTSATIIGLGYGSCETAEEKKARGDREEADRIERKKQNDARETKARRWRKGWTYSSAFEFSDDYRFIVPRYVEPAKTPLMWNSTMPIYPTGTLTTQ